MTAKELADKLMEIVQAGHGYLPVLFDTEAQTYNVHMVSVDSVYANLEEGIECVSLHEDAPHRSS